MAVSVIQYPAGSWGFVGMVPQVLACEASDPRYIRIAKESGPGFAKRIAAREGGSYRDLSWPSKEEALAAAAAAGIEVNGQG